MRFRRRLGRWVVLVFAGTISVAASGAKAPNKLDPEASCTTSECHAGIQKTRYVHGPVAENECGLCHEAKGNKHAFELAVEGPDLCTGCHDVIDPNAKVHEAAADDCTMCHNPHGSEARALLVTRDQKELCFACHDEVIMEGEYQHGPAAVGACSVCHDPHSSPNDKFLRETGKAMCALCHADLIEEMETAEYLHLPAEEDCALCHNPHSGVRARMLPGSTRELCGGCHEEITETADNATVRHGPAESVDGCVECHTPHGSANPALLVLPQKELCLGCHGEVTTEDGTGLQDMKAHLEANDQWHSPIREGGCTGCHQPHGSANFRLLLEAYPPKFYSPYDPDNYKLCFTCHESTVVKDKYTRTLTGFRDGDRNMHFLHVNKEKRGRTCRACHEVHASRQPRHVRDEVPYGNWMMPINFEKTETGGTCQPGCHAEKSYDREKRE